MMRRRRRDGGRVRRHRRRCDDGLRRRLWCRRRDRVSTHGCLLLLFLHRLKLTKCITRNLRRQRFKQRTLRLLVRIPNVKRNGDNCRMSFSVERGTVRDAVLCELCHRRIGRRRGRRQRTTTRPPLCDVNRDGRRRRNGERRLVSVVQLRQRSESKLVK